MMRILAVIPACEGNTNLPNKTVPNKNIRVIGGKPMIYYVIHNAKCSRYITNVIVTTNSNEIITIARQMGVMSKKRDHALCGEDVPLDVVVRDALQGLNTGSYDYVVTMQSISPTLRVETLDAAIEECINGEWDTVISVSNRPRFYWTTSEKGPHPLQQQRLNRHRLPPFFAETGAFLITRSAFAGTPQLGERIHLFEVSGEEAIDVDTFGDLKQVENILCHKHTAFYVNGNNQLGLGHVYRVIQLADELFSKPDIYYNSQVTDPAVFGETIHNLIPVEGEEGLFAALRQKQYSCFINDILSTSREYMEHLRNCLPDAKVVNFEDEGEGVQLADLVFNALYEESCFPQVRAGEQYFIVSKLFLIYDPISIRPQVKNVFVAFGAADPQNYSDRILRMVTEPVYKDYCFHVVLGSAKHNVEALMEYNHCPNIHVLYNIDNVAEVMSRCDIAISSRGRTGYELAVMGIPTITIAQNQRESQHNFLGETNGFTYLGIDPPDQTIQAALDEYLTMDQGRRRQLQRRMLAKDLRNGRKRVIHLIDDL